MLHVSVTVLVKVPGVATLCLVDKATASKVKCKVLTKDRLSSTPITKQSSRVKYCCGSFPNVRGRLLQTLYVGITEDVCNVFSFLDESPNLLMEHYRSVNPMVDILSNTLFYFFLRNGAFYM